MEAKKFMLKRFVVLFFPLEIDTDWRDPHHKVEAMDFDEHGLWSKGFCSMHTQLPRTSA